MRIKQRATAYLPSITAAVRMGFFLHLGLMYGTVM